MSATVRTSTVKYMAPDTLLVECNPQQNSDRILHQGRICPDLDMSVKIWYLERQGRLSLAAILVGLSRLLRSSRHEMLLYPQNQIPYSPNALSTIFCWLRFFEFQLIESNYSYLTKRDIWILEISNEPYSSDNINRSTFKDKKLETLHPKGLKVLLVYSQ